jgi:hypothetical protein
MKCRSFAIIGVLCGASAARAQSASCDAVGTHLISQDACQQAVDVFRYMAPQLGLAIAGGNATIGQGSSLGGLGHFSLGVRANAVMGTLPQVDKFSQSLTGRQVQTLPTKDNQWLPMPTADAALGIFEGIPLGLTNIGGLDLLVNASYIPNINQSSVSVNAPNGSWKFGYGARLGILQESIVVPGVSVTYLKRDLPEVNLSGVSGNDSLQVNSLDISTTAWRVTASKHFVIFGFVVGYGQDKYSQSATIRASVNQAGLFFSQSVADAQDLTRANMFADLSFNLPLFKIVAEVGQVSGGSVSTYNTFSGKAASASREYASAGLRFSW